MTARDNRSFIGMGAEAGVRARTGCHGRSDAGFSLVELLVVITIIGVLLAIGLVVGERVTTAAQKTATQGKLVVLDQALAAYQSDRGGANPPAMVRVSDPELTNPSDWRYMLLADAAEFGSNLSRNAIDPMVNSMGAFIAATDSIPSVRAIIEETSPPPLPYRALGTDQAEVPTVFDAFKAKPRVNADAIQGGQRLADAFASRVNQAGNNPIRFVHPSFDGRFTIGESRRTGEAGGPIDLLNLQTGTYSFSGIQPPAVLSSGSVGDTLGLYSGVTSIRRNFLTDADRENWSGRTLPIGDSDGGQCPNGQPYFYSPGPDGDPSTLEDNVYSIRPNLPSGS